MRRLEDEEGLGRSWKHEAGQDANQYSDGNEDDYSEWPFHVLQTVSSFFSSGQVRPIEETWNWLSIVNTNRKNPKAKCGKRKCTNFH